jgi:hypothetical protein
LPDGIKSSTIKLNYDLQVDNSFIKSAFVFCRPMQLFTCVENNFFL